MVFSSQRQDAVCQAQALRGVSHVHPETQRGDAPTQGVTSEPQPHPVNQVVGTATTAAERTVSQLR